MGKNRSIEAKRVKYLKQMKARPRFLKLNDGYIKTRQSITKDHVPPEARAMVQYRERAKIDEHKENKIAFVSAMLEALFPDLSKPKPVERQHEHMRLKVNAMEPVERKLLVQSTKFVKVAMLSNREMDCITLLEYQILPGILRRSISYSSYDRAMSVLQQKTVRWKDVLQIPNVEKTPLE